MQLVAEPECVARAVGSGEYHIPGSASVSFCAAWSVQRS